MPLNFTGMVLVEKVLEKDAAANSSPMFNSIVLAESSAGVSVPFSLSVWVNIKNNMFPLLRINFSIWMGNYLHEQTIPCISKR
jgi:hypothetical protein